MFRGHRFDQSRSGFACAGTGATVEPARSGRGDGRGALPSRTSPVCYPADRHRRNPRQAVAGKLGADSVENRDDGLSQFVQRVFRQAGDVYAAVADHIDGMLLA